MLSTRTELPEERSWGEALQRYDAVDRKKSAWERRNESMPVIKRVSQIEKGSDYNPLLSRHFEAKTELNRRDREAAEAVVRRARRGEKGRGQGYDIVTHCSEKSSIQASFSAAVAPIRKVNDHYNIISGRGGPETHESKKNPESTLHKKHAKGFDIVSNKYSEDHEKRMQDEASRKKQNAQRKFWKHRDYNAVVGRYYNEKKEAEFERQREVLGKIAGEARKAQLPPTLQFAEGASYDILSHVVKDQNKLNIVQKVGNRAITTKSLGPRVEMRLKSRQEDEFSQAKARMNTLQATAHFRQQQTTSHNFDLLSHLPRSSQSSHEHAHLGPESNLAHLQRTAPLLFFPSEKKQQHDAAAAAAAHSCFRDLSGARASTSSLHSTLH